MLIKLLLLGFICLLLFGGINKFRNLPKNKRRDTLVKVIIGGLVAILLLGVLTGRMHWFGAVLAAMVPLLRFGLGAATKLLPMWLHRSGGVATFKTEHLHVTVHVTQARISGEVIKGTYAGKRLEDLSEAQLDELAQDYQNKDTKSFYLIRMAKQRRGGSNEQPSGGPPPFSNPVREEALKILGLSDNPTRDDIIQAHRRLINKLHPDRGGSDFLAARVNQAKDVLLEQLEK